MSLNSLWCNAVNELDFDEASGHYSWINFNGKADAAYPYLTVSGRNASISYASTLLIHTLSGTQDGKLIVWFDPSFARFLTNGLDYSSIGFKLITNQGLHNAVDVLTQSPKHREVVIPLYDLKDLKLAKSAKRTPNTITGLQLLLVEDGSLDLIATGCSSDVWMNLPYDAFSLMMIQHLAAEWLNVKPNMFYYNIGSLDMFDPNEVAMGAVDSYNNSKVEPMKPVFSKHTLPISNALTQLRVDAPLLMGKELCGKEHLLASVFGIRSIITTLFTVANIPNYGKDVIDVEKLKKLASPGMVSLAVKQHAQKLQSQQA